MRLYLLLALILLFCCRAWAGSLWGGGDEEEAECVIVKEFAKGRTTRINRCVYNAAHYPIILGGKTFPRGIGVHCDSELRFVFREPLARFISAAGVDQAAFGRNVADKCSVEGGGKTLFESDTLAADGTRLELDIPLAGVTDITLKAWRPDGIFDSDWFDWGEARVVTRSGKTIWLDSILSRAKQEYAYPFSFRYNGVSSREFLEGLPLEVEDRDGRTVYTWSHPDGLRISCRLTRYEEGEDWTLFFENRGDKNSGVISDLAALDIRIADMADAPVTRLPVKPVNPAAAENNVAVLTMRGSVGYKGTNWNEFAPECSYLQTDAPLEVRHRGLASTSGSAAPYYSVKWPDGGVSFAIGWTGNWYADIGRDPDGVYIKADRDRVSTYLKPGETLRSARVLACGFEGPDMQTGLNAFRRMMIKHIIPKKDGKPRFAPICYESAWKTNVKAVEREDREFLRAFADLSFDTVWFDAWYTRDGFPKGVGNYHFPISDIPDPVRYPHGIKPLTLAAKAQKKDVMVWFAPETVSAGTFVAREHPEWVMSVNGGKSGFFALTDPEARSWMAEVLSACFREWKVDYFRTDSFTVEENLLAYTGENAPDRQGIAEDRFVCALYDFWDSLLERNPGLCIDNCAGGGTRLDPELMSRSVCIWRSDSHVGLYDRNKNNMLAQYLTCNLNPYIPWSTGSCRGIEPYDIRSCFNGGLAMAYGPDFTSDDKLLIEKGLAECRRLRKYLEGDFYPLRNPGPSADEWCIWQYHRPEADDGCLLAFRRHEAPVFGTEVSLEGVDEDKSYRLDIYSAYDLQESRVVGGKELKKLRLMIEEAPGSLLVEYRPEKI